MVLCRRVNMRLIDIEALSKITSQYDCKLMIDNTYCTPYLVLDRESNRSEGKSGFEQNFQNFSLFKENSSLFDENNGEF